jgi:hypothetical protein
MPRHRTNFHRAGVGQPSKRTTLLLSDGAEHPDEVLTAERTAHGVDLTMADGMGRRMIPTEVLVVTDRSSSATRRFDGHGRELEATPTPAALPNA